MTLRYKLGLTGTKLGCDRSECGACTVLIDDVPHYSCSILTHTVRNKRVVSIEGLESRGRQAASGAAGGGRRARLSVRVLHVGLRDGRSRLPQDESEPDARAARAWYLRQPLPLRGLQQDSEQRSCAARNTCGGRRLCRNQRYKIHRAGRISLNDLVAKVTGRAKYAEDFRAEGMLFAKLCFAPMPHARIRRMDTSAAMAIPGVRRDYHRRGCPETASADSSSAREPHSVRTRFRKWHIAASRCIRVRPIAAVAAIDELTAARRRSRRSGSNTSRCRGSWIRSSRCGPVAPNARAEGNVWRAAAGGRVQAIPSRLLPAE